MVWGFVFFFKLAVLKTGMSIKRYCVFLSLKDSLLPTCCLCTGILDVRGDVEYKLLILFHGISQRYKTWFHSRIQ